MFSCSIGENPFSVGLVAESTQILFNRMLVNKGMKKMDSLPLFPGSGCSKTGERKPRIKSKLKVLI